jgi:hypothetical protein
VLRGLGSRVLRGLGASAMPAVYGCVARLGRRRAGCCETAEARDVVSYGVGVAGGRRRGWPAGGEVGWPVAGSGWN